MASESDLGSDVCDSASLLDCAVCFERYGNNRKPKLLPCEHTYCHVCLHQMRMNNVIKCPDCREEHLVPPGGVTEFRPNLTMIKFLEQDNMKRRKQAAKAKSQDPSPREWHPHASKRSTGVSKEIQDLLSTLRVSIKEVHQSSGAVFGDTINKIQGERAALSNKYEATKSTIKRRLEAIAKAANQRKEELLNELEKSYKDSRALLTAQEDEYKHEKVLYEGFCKELSTTVEEFRKTGEAPTTIDELERHIHEAQSKARSLHPGKEISAERLVFNDDHCENILSDVKAWGNLNTELCSFRIPHPSFPEVDPGSPASDAAVGSPVYHYTNKGEAVRTYGNEPDARLNSPSCVAELPNGDIAVGSAMSYDISIFTSPHHKRSFRVGSPEVCQFNDGITGICMSPTGRLYVSSPDMNAIFSSTLDGKTYYQLQTVAADSEFSPRGMACTPSGELYVSDWANHVVRVFDMSCEIWQFGRRGSKPGEFKRPSGVALTPDGEVIVADCYNHRIQVFDGRTGQFLRLFGKEGSAMGDLKRPGGVAVDVKGYIAVSERLNNRVQLFTPKGQPFKLLSGQGQDQLNYPLGVAFSRDNEILVCDSRNDRLQVF
ncbi:tripartite motif-containing protein 3-like [Acanthaster planci]|uniref:Tripartite motif-containing protein 3-like n=1 Tax=Acanthaster planci TaxID=133434 RepID=A0A8B8A061_ACAPL|nr:tripartite motif-containing protein 3-like [Acanthaster planci]